MTKAKTSKKKPNFWHRRRGFAIQALIAVVLAYLTGSWALDSGSLIVYFVTFVLLGYAINRVMKIFRK